MLLALADGERHGYAIMQALAEMIGDPGAILPGTLYAVLARMVDEGQLEKVFGVPVTTRTWNTIQAIVRVLKNVNA